MGHKSLYLFCTYTHNSKGITSHDERSYPFLVVAGTGISFEVTPGTALLPANYLTCSLAVRSSNILPLSTTLLCAKILYPFLYLSMKDNLVPIFVPTKENILAF
jgi:hypothetical protein